MGIGFPLYFKYKMQLILLMTILSIVVAFPSTLLLAVSDVTDDAEDEQGLVQYTTLLSIKRHFNNDLEKNEDLFRNS